MIQLAEMFLSRNYNLFAIIANVRNSLGKIYFESKMEAFDLMSDEDELNNLNYCDISPTLQFSKANDIRLDLNKNSVQSKIIIDTD